MNFARTVVAIAGLMLFASAQGAAPVLPKDLPPLGADKPLPVPKIDESTLANGLKVWIVKRSGFPHVTAVLTVRGGRAVDPADAEGISDLLSATLRSGTATRSARDVAEALQAAGAELSVG